jgi:hypothetical protein
MDAAQVARTDARQVAWTKDAQAIGAAQVPRRRLVPRPGSLCPVVFLASPASINNQSASRLGWIRKIIVLKFKSIHETFA